MHKYRISQSETSMTVTVNDTRRNELSRKDITQNVTATRLHFKTHYTGLRNAFLILSRMSSFRPSRTLRDSLNRKR